MKQRDGCWIYYRQDSIKLWLPRNQASIPIPFVVSEILETLKREFDEKVKRALTRETNPISEPIPFNFRLRLNTHTRVAELEIVQEGAEEPNFKVTLCDNLARILGFANTEFKKPGVFLNERIVVLTVLTQFMCTVIWFNHELLVTFYRLC